MSDPITNRDQAKANIRSYQQALADRVHGPEMRNRMKRVIAWYAIRQAGGAWLFGPSRFIGYPERNAGAYVAEPGDGRVTESVLKNWSDVVSADTSLGSELTAALRQFLKDHGHSRPNKNARISVFSGVSNEIPKAAETQERIRVDPEICGGRPHVRGTRVRVSDILQLLAAGVAPADILADYPYLEDADLRAALAWGAAASEHRIVHAA